MSQIKERHINIELGINKINKSSQCSQILEFKLNKNGVHIFIFIYLFTAAKNINSSICHYSHDFNNLISVIAINVVIFTQEITQHCYQREIK